MKSEENEDHTKTMWNLKNDSEDNETANNGTFLAEVSLHDGLYPSSDSVSEWPSKWTRNPLRSVHR
eukprot:292725-Amphidinium_carterae.1